MVILKQSELALEKINSGKYPDTVILDIRKRDLKKGLRLHDSKYIFIVHDTVLLELTKETNDANFENAKYILFSTDENQSYYQELLLKEDKFYLDDKLILEFLDPLPNLNYSLKVDFGTDDDHYFIFENKPYSELVEELK